MVSRTSPARATLALAALALCLGALPAAQAKGGKKSSASRSGHADDRKEKDTSGWGAGLRAANNRAGPNRPGAGATEDAASERTSSAEEAARNAASAAVFARAQEARSAAESARIAQLEARRAAEDKAAAEQLAAQQKAESARLDAAQEVQRRADAAVAADVNQVLERAMADHPVLRTPQGQAFLQSILDRQKALAARGLYPSIAMVEAVADHADLMTPKVRPALYQSARPAAPVTTPAAPDTPAVATGHNACAWKTPLLWVCAPAP